jgi:hypothetical protein
MNAEHQESVYWLALIVFALVVAGCTKNVSGGNVQEAVRAYYFDQPQTPRGIRLHLVKGEP